MFRSIIDSKLPPSVSVPEYSVWVQLCGCDTVARSGSLFSLFYYFQWRQRCDWCDSRTKLLTPETAQMGKQPLNIWGRTCDLDLCVNCIFKLIYAVAGCEAAAVMFLCSAYNYKPLTHAKPIWKSLVQFWLAPVKGRLEGCFEIIIIIMLIMLMLNHQLFPCWTCSAAQLQIFSSAQTQRFPKPVRML